MSEIWTENSQSFDVWRTLAATGVKRLQEQGHLYKSGHEALRSSDAMHTPDADQQILSEMANQNLKKVNFWCVVLPPTTPDNPYLRRNAQKMGHCLITNPFMHALESPVCSKIWPLGSS